MFLFIGGRPKSEYIIKLFKYISCSYLSSGLKHLLIQFHYLNTSHVLIYHHQQQFYIFPEHQFKYISCSYLSSKREVCAEDCRDLNTSHVLIYPISSNV